MHELLQRIATSSLVTIVGPSGSGKSSVIRAGLVPALRSGELEGSTSWRIVSMAPGAHPFAQRESALVRAADDPTLTNLEPQLRGDDLDVLRAVLRILPEGGRLALVVDQFEELFLQGEDDAERDRFIRNLAEALEDPHSGLIVVAALRADVLHLPMAHPRLGSLLVDGIVHVLPLTPAELAAACVAPAARVGVTVAPELAGELVAEVTEHPGALPLFQYALTELFDHRHDDSMGLQGYRELGEVSGVVARRAEQMYASLDRSGQGACRHPRASGAVEPTSRHRVHRTTRHRGVVRRTGRAGRSERLPRSGCRPDTVLGPPRLTGHRGCGRHVAVRHRQHLRPAHPGQQQERGVVLDPGLRAGRLRDPRFDGSDLLPHQMGLWPMYGAMVEFVGAGPDNRERLLADLEATWVERELSAGPATVTP